MASKTIANLNIKLSAGTGQLQRDLGQAAGTVGQFGASVKTSAASIGSAVTRLVGQAAALAGIGSIGAGVGWGLKLAAEAEQAQVAFGTLLGSASRAQQLLGELRDFAAATPFEFPELRDAARSLVAFGVQAGDVTETLRRIGDISSGVGQPIGEIAELYGKAKVQGRLFQEDINQLTGRGIPIIQQLAAQFGVAESGVRKLVESGQVNFQNLERAFITMTSTGGQFAGMMAAQSLTLAGRWSTLKDNVGALALSLGETLLPAAGKLVDGLTSLVAWVQTLDGDTVALTAKTVTFGLAFVGVLWVLPKIVAGIMAIVGALRTLTSAQAIATAMGGPAGWARLAISAGVAAAAVAGVSSAFAGLSSSATDAAGSAQTAGTAVEGIKPGPLLELQDAAKAAGDAVEGIKPGPLLDLKDAAKEAEKALAGVTQEAEKLNAKGKKPIEMKLTVDGKSSIMPAEKARAAFDKVEFENRRRKWLPGIELRWQELPGIRLMFDDVKKASDGATQSVNRLATSVDQAAGAAQRGQPFIEEFAQPFVEEAAQVSWADDVARGLAGLRETPKSFESLRASAKRFTEELATPAEKLEKELEKIKTLVDNRLISEETADRGRTKLRADYEAAQQAAEKIEESTQRLQAVGSVMKNSREDFAAIDAARRQIQDHLSKQPPIELNPSKGDIPRDVLAAGKALNQQVNAIKLPTLEMPIKPAFSQRLPLPDFSAATAAAATATAGTVDKLAGQLADIRPAVDFSTLTAGAQQAAATVESLTLPDFRTLTAGAQQAAAAVESLTLPDFSAPAASATAAVSQLGQALQGLQTPDVDLSGVTTSADAAAAAASRATRPSVPSVPSVPSAEPRTPVPKIQPQVQAVQAAGQQFRELVRGQQRAESAQREATKVLTEIATNTKTKTKITKATI